MHTFVFIRMPVYFCPFWWISAFWPLHTHDTAQQQHSNCSKGTNMYIKHTYVQIWYTVYIYIYIAHTYTYILYTWKQGMSFFFPNKFGRFQSDVKKNRDDSQRETPAQLQVCESCFLSTAVRSPCRRKKCLKRLIEKTVLLGCPRKIVKG